MKFSLKPMVFGTTLGVSLLAPAFLQAQVVIKSPAVHKTAAAKNFVRPADPRSILRSAHAVGNAQPVQRKAGDALSPFTSGRVANPSSLKAQTPYERILKPALRELYAKTPVPTGITQAAKKSATAKSTLAANFPGLQSTPFVSGTNPNDASPVVASLSMDVDQDGKMDLVTVQNDGTVNVLLGTNTFSALKVTSINQPQLLNDVYYVSAVAVDMNKDGYPDLVVTDEQDTAAFVYINAKNGTFLPPVEYDFSFSSGAGFYTAGGGIGVGDINGDGYPDLVGVVYSPPQGYETSTTVSIVSIMNNGDGTLGAPLPEQTTMFGGYINAGIGQVLLADMNNDGKLDLILPASGNDINYNHVFGLTILPGVGDGTFAPFPSTFAPIASSLDHYYDDSIASFATADVNGDGKLDVIFSCGFPAIFVALGNGDGTLQDPTVVVSNDGTANDGGPPVVQYADVNGDGNIDIIAYDGGFTAVYLGQGGGVFAQTPLVQLISGSGGLVQPLPADYTGDGKLDLVEVDQETGDAGLFTQSSGTFLGLPAMAPPGETAQAFQTVLVGHVSGLGFPDIIAQDQSLADLADDDYSAAIVAGINDGKGNFTYSTMLTSAQLSPFYISSVAPVTADLNGDGRTDLVMQGYPDLYVSLSNGDGTYAAPVALGLANSAPCGLGNIDIGDVNGDGFPDIIVAYAGDSICYPYSGPVGSGFFVLLNDGKGNFTSSFTPYGFAAYLPKLVDLDGDGKLDLVLSDLSANLAAYYLYAIPGNGDGTFNTGASQYVLENSVVTSVTPGDFNGDGKQDLVVGVATQIDYNGYILYGTTGTETLAGNGDFTFQQPIQYTPGLYPVAASYGDFNSDGRPDLAVVLETYGAFTDIYTGNATTLINLGGGAFAPGPSTFTSPDSSAGYVFTADFNGDGAVDALFSPQVHLSGFFISGLSELFLNNGGIALTLSSSAASIPQDSSETLTATLAPTVSSQTPSGTVTFYDNGVSLGSVPVASGQATLTLSTLPVGTDSITASYSGDSNFNPATASTAVTVTVAALAPAFTLGAPTPAALSVMQGQSVVATFAVTSNATFSGNILLTCSGMPAETSCVVSPASVTLSGSQTVTLSAVVSTTAPNNTYEASTRHSNVQKTIGGISVACVFFFLLPASRRRRKVGSLAIIVCMGISAMTCLSGCGGNGSDKYPGTPAGSATLTITATSGTSTQTTTFTVNVSK